MQKNPANFWVRLLAHAVDFMLFLLPQTFFLSLLATSSNLHQFNDRLFFYLSAFLPLFVIVSLLYKPLTTSFFGASLGKSLAGLFIVDNENKKLSFKKSFFRHSFGYFLSGIFFGLGFLSVLIDNQHKSWHDKLSGSQVVVKNNLWPLATVVLGLAFIANFLFLVSSVSSFATGPLPKQITESLSDQPKRIDEYESFLYQQQYPANTDIRLILKNN